MSPVDSLARFFEAMPALLLGRTSAAAVEMRLGPCPAGTASLGFYATLVRRNLDKILRDVFAAVHGIARASSPSPWSRWVAAYADAHPPGGIDPNGFAAAFPGWLAAQPEVPAVLGELADFEWLRVQSYHARDTGPEPHGLGRRLFVRHYTDDVPAIAAAAWRGQPWAQPPRASTVLVYRHAITAAACVHRPAAIELVALAQRCGTAVPDAFAALPPAQLDAAAARLHARGVLEPTTNDRTSRSVP